MQRIHYFFLSLIFFLCTAGSAHKFYVSITKIEYVKEEKSLQIITQIFSDDIEEALRKRHLKEVNLGTKKETQNDEDLLLAYVKKKMTITVNGIPVEYIFVGKEYTVDQVKMYIEIPNITSLSSLEIENKILFDAFEDQQNIIHIKTLNTRRSLVLEAENPKGLLKF